MSQELINLNLTEDDFTKIDAALDALEKTLTGLINPGDGQPPDPDSAHSRIGRLHQLLGHMEQTEQVLSEKLMNQCLEGYVALRAAGKGQELDALYQDMCAERAMH